MTLFTRWESETGERSRFIIVGGVGAIFAWATYSLIHYILPFENRALIAWVSGYLIAVAQQHSLHRRFTFFSTEEPFLPELSRAYVAYSLGLLISTVIHAHLTMNMLIHHQISWAISTAVSVVSNFVTLKLYVYKMRNF